MSPALLLLGALQAAWAGTAVDQRGVSVTVGPTPKVVVLGASAGETVDLLGRGDTIVAADAGHKMVPSLAARATLSYHRQTAAEGVLSQAPDVVVATETTGPEAALRQVEAAGVPVFMVPEGHAVEQIHKRVTALGALLDAPDKATALLASLDADLAKAAERAASVSGKRLLFIYARGAGTLMVAGTETGADALLALAGIDNAVQGHKGYLPLTPESAVAAAPDALLLTTHGLQSLGGEDALRKLPGIAQLGDVPILTAEDLLLLGFGPRTGEGVLKVQDALLEALR